MSYLIGAVCVRVSIGDSASVRQAAAAGLPASSRAALRDEAPQWSRPAMARSRFRCSRLTLVVMVGHCALPAPSVASPTGAQRQSVACPCLPS